MKIEHVAFNVADPRAMAAWYVAHLGLTSKRSVDAPPYAQFLADDGDQVMIELYANTAAPIPDYRSVPPAVLHLALYTEDVEAERARLVAAGGTAEGDVARTPAGDAFAFVRDPWGFCLQLVRRGQRMI